MLPYTCKTAKMRVCQAASQKATKRFPLQPFGNIAKHLLLHPKRCFGNLYANLQRQPCQLVVQQTKMQCKISKYRKKYRRNIEPKVAKSSSCEQNARSPLQVRIKVAKTAFWVQMEVFCNIAKRLQWQPFGGLLGDCLAYTHFGDLASIWQHCQVTFWQPFGNVAKHFLTHPKQTKIVLSRGPFCNLLAMLPVICQDE